MLDKDHGYTKKVGKITRERRIRSIYGSRGKNKSDEKEVA